MRLGKCLLSTVYLRRNSTWWLFVSNLIYLNCFAYEYPFLNWILITLYLCKCHWIELLNDKPFKEPCRRIRPALYGEVKQHNYIGDAWHRCYTRVQKSVLRECGYCQNEERKHHFRKLNARTKKDAYAIPRVEDTLHMLAGAKYFSKLDLKSGYWQIELDEADKAKTAFQVWNVGCLGESFALWAR